MAEEGFVLKWFVNSLAKKGATSFLAGLAMLAVGPHVAPILKLLGITIVAVAAPEPSTVITIVHATFAAGAGAAVFMLIEGARVLFAKHPAVKIPLIGEKANATVKAIL